MLMFWFMIITMLLAAVGLIVFSLRAIRKIFMICCSVIFAILAIGLYLHWGNWQPLAIYSQQKKNSAIVDAELKQLKSPEALIQKMQMVLRDRPTDAKGWFLLGRLYMSTEQYALAEEAFTRANQLQPKQITTMEQLVQASFFAHQTITNESHQIIKQILLLKPDHPYMLNFLALDAYAHHRYREAVGYWKKLLPQLEPQSEEAKKLVQAIAEASNKK